MKEKWEQLLKWQKNDKQKNILLFPPTLTFAESATIWNELPHIFSKTNNKPLSLDLRNIAKFDSSAVIIIHKFQELAKENSVSLELLRTPQSLQKLLDIHKKQGIYPPSIFKQKNDLFLVKTANTFPKLTSNIGDAIGFTGELAISLFHAVRSPHRIRWRDTLLHFQHSGVEALPIVLMICFLMGVIMAFQASVQLHQFGADIFVADLVGLSITRELGPLMVAIICCGRSGAAFAAEIGTMKVGEEINAMLTMGLRPSRFLITPKLLALVFALPCLTLLGDLVGVIGGLIIGTTVLDLTATSYISETLSALSFADIFSGLFKSICFAILISSIGCYYGFRTGNSAQSVGKATTSAVVTGIFSVILADALFTIIFNMLGI